MRNALGDEDGHVVLNRWSDGTVSQLSLGWLRFVKSCVERNVDPLAATEEDVRSALRRVADLDDISKPRNS